ncbi:MAG TPA: sigma-54 dependent transcriptional regulator [Syntrophorhabdus sp.]|jgi:DNA-binding NtrC family response regulator|nr:sigma-54-dependent Fis family transcriptional regulator [Syntrophorhabdus sp.]MDI9557994.1 sigma-54 dependent transcriptional regulator [Pseudomonadota bacterium]OPX93620.1 MAG: Transcriptional regulatory protein ZraR [Syntrophorhabdus sp. PtaB.Bin027]OQB76915.1 MAG: Transcriptional regulatory protein ZraR [Deltaproteobacteria bacterium ADurb.Bin135]MBP8743956.1 sigma-54-dependent Fis family transcriptional regulator [Syntrophorhabdus sp.]
MKPSQILIVEDDRKMRLALREIMTKEGYSVDTVETGEAALGRVEETSYDLVITDLKLPGIDGMSLLKAIRKSRPDTSVVIITAYATVDTAVEAMREGAEDYISKPFNLDEIRIIVKKVLEKKALLDDNRLLRNQLKKKYSYDNVVGNSEAMIEVYKTIDKVKDAKATVLILGETGTGKELVARAIHYNSTRSGEPFLPVNCAALTESLLESELFGYVKGAFTGALKDKLGVFETADGGTVFLDEIGDISPRLQQVLLRVLENGEIQPVGSTARKKVDVRVVAATNKNLEELMKTSLFRADLYYRLNVISLRLPSLLERKEDIPALANHFLRKYSAENNKTITGISKEALQMLEGYNWPGNVRELENVIERATLLETTDEITVDSLSEKIRSSLNRSPVVLEEDLRTLEEVGRAYIIEVLEKTGGNKVKTSEILGINRTSLWRMMQRLKIVA